MICSIFGHRIIEEAIDEGRLLEIFKSLITERGIDTFYFGGLSEFDALCHTLITRLKKDYPFIRRVFCLVDENQLRPNKRARYFCEEDYEDFLLLPTCFNGWYKRIYFRNLAMIDESDSVVFYAKKRPESGAYKAYRYAIKKKRYLINIADSL